MSSIEAGQVFRRHDPVENVITRIRVKAVTRHGSGLYGAGTAQVVTLTEDGREVRPRRIKLDQLHLGPIGKNGRPRRTGYVLEAGQ